MLYSQVLTAQLDVNGAYDRITVYDGLSSDFVQFTLQDKKGYIWIATNKGLDRFDGKNIKQFTYDPQDSTSLIYNYVLSMVMDKNDRLWVATRGGLCIKEEDDTFTRFKTDANNKPALPHNNITALFEDSKGRMWVGTQNGLCLYNEASKTFKVFQYDEEDSTSIGLNSTEEIFEDSNGNIWVSTWAGGISVVDESHSNNIQFKRLNFGTKNKIGGGCFPSFFEDKLGRIWTYKNDNKLVQIKFPLQKNILDCTIDEIDIVYYDLEPEVEDYQIYTFKFIENKFLLISTNLGLKTIDAEAFSKTTIEDLKPTYKDIGFDFNIYRCNHFQIDKFGIIWMSTSIGLFKLFNIVEESIPKKLNDFCVENELDILSLTIDKENNNKWIGTDKGLFLFDKDLKIHQKITLSNNNYADVKGGISALHQDYNGHVWAGTFLGKLYGVKDGVMKEHHLKTLEDDNKRNIIWDIIYIEDRLWLSTDQGLIVFDPITKSYQELFAKNTPGLEGDNVFDVIKDNENTIWAAFTGGGLTKVFLDENGALGFEQKSKGLNSNLILDMDLAEDDIWMATVSGIQRYNIKEDKFYSNEFLKASVSGTIISITHDANNNLWFVYDNGLNYYNRKKQQLATFNTFDGVAAKLSMKCTAFDSEGNIYFGGKDGVNIFKTHDLIKEDTLDKIIFTNLMIANESIIKNKKDEYLEEPILTQSIEQTKAITLTQKHINIKFDFTIPDFLNPHMYKFSYTIKNLTPNWIDLKNTNSINVTNFSEGNYVLLIKATDIKGTIYKTKELNIEVLPYFWQRWWFILGCLLGAVLAIFYIIKLRERRIAAQKKMLASIVKERTTELKAKNEKLENYIKSNMQLEQFAHAVAHDLKSPMVTVSSFTSLLKKKLADKLSETELGYINYIEVGCKRLIDLVNDMLAYAKINSENLSIDYNDPKVLVNEVIDQLKASIDEKNAVVRIKSNVEKVQCDKIKTKRVIQNLIGNAIKFVPNGKQPIIDVSIHEIEDDNQFSIKDNGIGISEESQKVVFDVFKRVAYDSAYDGTGMGLAVCKRIVEHHGGNIWIDSTEGLGSTFIFTIPKEPKSVLPAKV